MAGCCAGDDVGMVLSPQCFHNINVDADIFNHSNINFWEYAQRGYDALGFISCTGTPNTFASARGTVERIACRFCGTMIVVHNLQTPMVQRGVMCPQPGLVQHSQHRLSCSLYI